MILATFALGVYLNAEPTPNQLNLSDFSQFEIDMIKKEAIENKLPSKYLSIVFAIRKAESGSKGREFGILHPKCLKLCRENPNDTFEIQAGWCCATVAKNVIRWQKAGKKQPFITFLGNRYCPPTEHELNKNWIPNVNKWVNKIQQSR